MHPDIESVLPEIAFAALLGEVLRECAREPLLFLDAARSDSTLVRIARNGAARPDPFDEILTEVYESTRRPMLEWAARVTPDPEELVRGAFIRVYARRPETGDLRDHLWRGARKLVRDTRGRTGTRREPVQDEEIESLARRAELSFEDTITVRHMLIAALATLPGREREAVVLHGYTGAGHAEVARMMGAPPGAVPVYVRAGLATIRERLGLA
ncbi:sigma factor-like helix-turn-helix DNA-binding protein [Nocardia sp. NPDC048505]|uniref:RNA polymerase sigma factor n=1 Tax=Nocardia sp. NPDC048505 TaxID=3155756 RepID=UPI0033ED5708